ncbi:nucleotide-diphospho-sugar transferase-domain-containing protein [Haematococcus lacustris]
MRLLVLAWLALLAVCVSALSHKEVPADLQFHGYREDAEPCPALSKELLQKHAKRNLVMLMAVDKNLFKRFGPSWIQNVETAGITFWFVGALDPWTSKALGSMGVKQCFNAPMDQLGYKGSGNSYQWGSKHWHQTTWNKVFIVRAVYAMGFDVLHADADSTWHADPLDWFMQFNKDPETPPHALFSTDSLETRNEVGDNGLEASTSPYHNINTGIYWVKQWSHGLDFFASWLDFFPQKIGHDQDGLNNVVRGEARQGQKELGTADWDQNKRIVWCATNKTAAVSLLPVHLFGNAYTYVTGQVHKRYNSTLYATHWVWTGGSPECKIQNVRDAGKYLDPPEYYGQEGPEPKPGVPHPPPLMLLTMDLDRPTIPDGYNQLPFNNTEDMIQFHIAAGTYQLRQAYYGIMAAMALGRTWVLPGFHCYCARNWYMTQRCRINGETHTMFPYKCALADLLRARKVLQGITIRMGYMDKRVVHVREYSFLDNAKVPAELKASRLVLAPAATATPKTDDPLPPLVVRQVEGVDTATVPWPLNTDQLAKLVGGLPQAYRIIHLANATLTLGNGWADPKEWTAFDKQIQVYKAYWCCRSPADQERLKAPDKISFEILPADRKLLLAPAS